MIPSANHSASRLVGVALASLLLVVGAACGDDDSEASSGGATTTTANPNDRKFCDGIVASDAASAEVDPQSPTPDQIEAAKQAMAPLPAIAPAAIADDVKSAVADAAVVLGGGEEPPTLAGAMDSIYGWADENCGFNKIAATAADYRYDGLAESVPAGQTMLRLKNDGKEMHEMLVLRVNDGVTTPLDELLALPEEEAKAKVTTKGVVFVAPGKTANSTADMPAGRYIILCAIPKGLTPAVMGAPEGSAPPELGPPHFTEGMVKEIAVS